jgi:putative spermidine/putrescine transport system ATP-binding protein
LLLSKDMHAAPPSGQPLLLDRITHRYAGHNAVDGVTLDIAGGELVALLGPSGCGETTLLRIVAGLVQQTAGRVVVGSQAVDALPPSRRPVGIVFQSYALFPHMTVAGNVAYGFAVRGVSRAARRQEATDAGLGAARPSRRPPAPRPVRRAAAAGGSGPG